MIEDNEDALKRFNEEMHNNKTGDLPNSQNAQNVYSNVDPKLTQQLNMVEQQIKQNMINMGPPPNASVPTTFGKCPDCGLMHPPLPQGQKCPAAPLKNKTTNEDIDLTHFMGQIRTIAISQIQTKNIKDIKKMLAHIVITVTQTMENYKE